MKSTRHNLKFSESFREGAKEFLDVRSLSTLIALPAIIALASMFEQRLELDGLIGPLNSHQALRLKLWNVSLIVSFMALIQGCLGLRRIWDTLWRSGRERTAEDFSGSVISLFMVYFLVVCLIGMASMLVTDGLSIAGIFFLVGWCMSPLIWSVCLASLLSLLTSGGGAAWLGGSIFLFSLIPGLIHTWVPDYAVPPLGKLVASTVQGAFHPRMMAAIMLHAFGCLVAASLLFWFRRRPSMRWQG